MKTKTSIKSGDVQYTIQPGDNLWYIARRMYGKNIDAGAAANYIYAFNKNTIGSNPNIIQPGMVITIPEPPKVVAPVPLPLFQ